MKRRYAKEYLNFITSHTRTTSHRVYRPARNSQIYPASRYLTSALLGFPRGQNFLLELLPVSHVAQSSPSSLCLWYSVQVSYPMQLLVSFLFCPPPLWTFNILRPQGTFAFPVSDKELTRLLQTSNNVYSLNDLRKPLLLGNNTAFLTIHLNNALAEPVGSWKD